MSNPRAFDSDVPILRAESVAAWREGERFLEQAKCDAAESQRQANDDAQHAREQARQEGYEQGRQEGLEDAARLALQMTTERDAYLQSLTPRLAQAIDASVRKILGELDNAELIERVARKAMEDIRGAATLTLRVPQGMVDALGQDAVFAGSRKVIVVEDDALQDASCFLETPLGTIELNPHTQWERIFRAMDTAEGKSQ